MRGSSLPGATWGPVRAFLGAVLLLVPFLAAAGAVAVARKALSVPPDYDLLVASIPLYLGMVAIAWALGPASTGGTWANLGLRPARIGADVPFALLGVGAILGFTAGYVLLMRGLGLDRLVPPKIELPGVHGPVLVRGIAYFIVGVAGPIGEEVFFRGFLLGGLAKKGTVFAILGSALIFAVFHGAIGVIIPVVFAGLVLGWLYVRSGSLFAPALAHMLQNTVAFASLGGQP
ncbi:MAG: CPBP family intramembrane metalloprotease [Chloroflexi bacterium]|nr:CPBP family intramembrane metalloprotease [Chloroflexota bacterium]